MKLSKDEKNYCKKDIEYLRKTVEEHPLNKTAVQCPMLHDILSYKKFKKRLFFYAPTTRIIETKENIRIEVPCMGKTIVVENRKEVIKGNTLDIQTAIIKMMANIKYGRLYQ